MSLTTAPTGSPTFTNSHNVYIGNRADLTRAFNGWISMFAIWKGVLLGSTDATNLHNGIAPCALSSTPAFYAPLDQGDSPETELVAANNLTVTGTTVVSGSSAFANAHCSGLTRTLMGVGQ